MEVLSEIEKMNTIEFNASIGFDGSMTPSMDDGMDVDVLFYGCWNER